MRLELIPLDIIVEIIIKLPISSIKQLAQCNKKLNKICKNKYLWKCKYDDDFSRTASNNFMNKYIKIYKKSCLIPVYLIDDNVYSDGTFNYRPYGYLNKLKLRDKYFLHIFSICGDDSLIIFVDENDTIELFTIIVNSKIYTFNVNSENILDKNVLLTGYIIKEPYNLRKYIKKLQYMTNLETTKKELLKLIIIYINCNDYIYRKKFEANPKLQIVNDFDNINEELLQLIKNKNQIVSCKIKCITSKGEIKQKNYQIDTINQ